VPEKILQDALIKGIRLAILPIAVLNEIKADIEEFSVKNTLNDFQKWFIENRYIFDTKFADAGFVTKSLVVAVWKGKVSRLVFQYEGIKAACLIEDGIINRGINSNPHIKQIFDDAGFSLKYTNCLPQKRLAVCSGLCEYGRNNIAYCGDWGSFVHIGTYISDIPSDDNYFWRDAVSMENCKTCGKCIKNCPTNAIKPDCFLIDCELCLSMTNSNDRRRIPDWVPKSAHHCLYGCYDCQEICPANAKRLENQNLESIYFDETETLIMAKSRRYSDFPKETKEKLWHFSSGKDFACVVRNLRLMLENAYFQAVDYAKSK